MLAPLSGGATRAPLSALHVNTWDLISSISMTYYAQMYMLQADGRCTAYGSGHLSPAFFCRWGPLGSEQECDHHCLTSGRPRNRIEADDRIRVERELSIIWRCHALQLLPCCSNIVVWAKRRIGERGAVLGSNTFQVARRTFKDYFLPPNSTLVRLFELFLYFLLSTLVHISLGGQHGAASPW